MSDNRKAKERMAHFIPMLGIGFCLFLLLRDRKRGLVPALVITVVTAGLISLSIECLQELLPESFAHGFALSDIWTSLAGSLLGATLGILHVLGACLSDE